MNFEINYVDTNNTYADVTRFFFDKRDVSISPKILVMRLANYIKNDALFHYVFFFA